MSWTPCRCDWPNWKDKVADPEGNKCNDKRNETSIWMLYRFSKDTTFSHLACLAVHVECDNNATGDFTSAAVHQVFSQPCSKVALTRSTWPRQDETAMFKQQTDVVLHHGFGDKGFKYQAVYTLLLQT